MMPWSILFAHRERIEKNFWPKVDRSGDCWVWRGGSDRAGYGRFSLNVNGKTRTFIAHRLAVMLDGRDPGESLDHLCRNRACVNPAHLESVPLSVNRARGNLAWRAEMTECKRGHEFTPENTHVYRGSRSCRACAVLTQQRYMARRAERGGQ